MATAGKNVLVLERNAWFGGTTASARATFSSRQTRAGCSADSLNVPESVGGGAQRRGQDCGDVAGVTGFFWRELTGNSAAPPAGIPFGVRSVGLNGQPSIDTPFADLVRADSIASLQDIA
jgi:hypothetical protein